MHYMISERGRTIGTESRWMAARKLRGVTFLMGHSWESLRWYFYVLYGIQMAGTRIYTFVKIDRNVQYKVKFIVCKLKTKIMKLPKRSITECRLSSINPTSLPMCNTASLKWSVNKCSVPKSLWEIVLIRYSKLNVKISVHKRCILLGKFY